MKKFDNCPFCRAPIYRNCCNNLLCEFYFTQSSFEAGGFKIKIYHDNLIFDILIVEGKSRLIVDMLDIDIETDIDNENIADICNKIIKLQAFA